MKRYKVSVIILNWNGYKDTTTCVNAVQKSIYPHYEILIVDNASTNESEKVLRKTFPHITFIQTGNNLGYAGGNNIGIEKALKNGSDYVLILNNDCIIDSHLLSEMVQKAEKDKRIGLITPKVYSHDNVISHIGSKLNWFSPAITTFIGENETDHGQYDNEQSVDIAPGDCLFINSLVFKKIGLLNPTYFLYYEDTDWSIRVKDAGLKIIYLPTAKAWHEGSHSTGNTTSALGSYYILRNKFQFAFYFAPWNAKLYHLGYFFLSLSKNFLSLLLKQTDKQIYSARLHALLDVCLGKRGKVSIP